MTEESGGAREAAASFSVEAVASKKRKGADVDVDGDGNTLSGPNKAKTKTNNPQKKDGKYVVVENDSCSSSSNETVTISIEAVRNDSSSTKTTIDMHSHSAPNSVVAVANEANGNETKQQGIQKDETKTSVEIEGEGKIVDENEPTKPPEKPEAVDVQKSGTLPQNSSTSPKDVSYKDEPKTSDGIEDSKTQIETKESSPSTVDNNSNNRSNANTIANTKDVEENSGITKDQTQTETMTKIAPPKQVQASNTRKIKSNGIGDAETDSQAESKKPLPKDVNSNDNNIGIGITADQTETITKTPPPKEATNAGKSSGIGDAKTLTETKKPIPNNDGNSNISDTNDVETSEGTTEDQTETRTKASAINSGKISGIGDAKTLTETKKSLPEAKSSSSNNINANDVEMSEEITEDRTETRKKKSPPKETVISGKNNGSGDTKTLTETEEASNNVVNNNNIDTSDVEMSEGITEDQTEIRAKVSPPKEIVISEKSSKIGDKKIQKRKRTINNTLGMDDSKEDDSESGYSIGHTDHGSPFRSSAEDALAKALSLALRNGETEASQTPDTISARVNENDPPGDVEIPIEILRDLINQNPGEFWQSKGKSNGEGNTPAVSNTNKKAATGGKDRTDLVFYKRIEAKTTNENEDCSGNQAKRRRIEYSNKNQEVEPQTPPRRSNNQEIGSYEAKKETFAEDRETLEAVRVLLEAAIGRADASKGLLEQIHPAPTIAATGNETETGIPTTIQLPVLSEEQTENGVQGIAHKVTRSFIQDLSEVLQAITNAGSCIGPATEIIRRDDNKDDQQSVQPPTKSPQREPAVEISLLCDEKDILQLREDKKQNMDDEDNDKDDDEIMEISPDENYVQQHILCDQKAEEFMCFGEETINCNHVGGPTRKEEEDLLVAQKVALLRETKRLIRIKTLVLTKRRLAIPEDDDLSLVI